MLACIYCGENEFVVSEMGFDYLPPDRDSYYGGNYQFQAINKDCTIYQHRCVCCGGIHLFDRDRSKDTEYEFDWKLEKKKHTVRCNCNLATIETVGDKLEAVLTLRDLSGPKSKGFPVDKLDDAKKWAEKWLQHR